MSRELPPGWVEATVGDISEVSGGVTKNSKRESLSIERPYLRVANVYKNELRLDDVQTIRLSEAELGRVTLQQGDLLIVEGNGSLDQVGRVALWDGSVASCVHQNHLIKSRIFGGVSSKFVLYWLLSERGRAAIEGEASSSAGLHTLSLSKVSRLPVPVAPLPEQHRIVERIEALLAKGARAKAALDALPPLLDRYRQSLLAAAFRGDLTADWRRHNPDVLSAVDLVDQTPAPQQPRGGREATESIIPGRAASSVNNPGTALPSGWAWTPLLRIARQETGHTPTRAKPEYWGGNVPWMGIRDAGANHGQIIADTNQHVTRLGLENSSARLLPAGTVCLSRTASVGYVTIMGKEMATSQDFATWTCTSALLPEYLMYALMAEGDDIRNFGEGTTHTTIYFPEIRALHIGLAPFEEQAEIVRMVKLGLQKIEQLSSTIESSASQHTTLTQSILAKAFRGELVPQDPADEPASVLLERIRAERGEMPKRGRRAGKREHE